MFTPQQIEQISFGRATFGGYDMQAVDEFLEPLTEDYVTLYKENALLKSKMRVLVAKLEEYRKNEASMRDAIVNAQKTCDLMIKEAEAKCTQMLSQASENAVESTKNADALVAEEQQRVEEAKKAAAAKIQEIQDQMNACVQALERIKTANRPEAPKAAVSEPVQTEPTPKVDPADAVADEIASSLEALVGTTDDIAPKPEANHPVSTTSTRFRNLEKQFGPNYNPGN
jgi:cell division initiation protein